MAETEKLLDVLDLGGQSPAGEIPSDTAVPLRLHGLPRVPHYIEYTRDLTEADIAATRLNGRMTPPKTLLQIRSSHHALARCLASGMKPAQAALVSGYTTARIWQLQGDEAFQALVADYRGELKAITADMTERMTNLSLDALEILQERLSDNPEGFTIPALLEVVKTFADRTGHGPGQEVNLRIQPTDLIDRPPRETHEEWAARRAKELEGPAPEGPSGPTAPTKWSN